MSAKPPETFGLDRLQTPIGVALLVTDSGGERSMIVDLADDRRVAGDPEAGAPITPQRARSKGSRVRPILRAL